MLKDFMEFLSGTKMTVISAFFLLASLCFMLTGTKAFPDPVWGTIFISGTPIIYKALKKLFFCRCISSPLLITTAMLAAIAVGELFAAGEVALIMAVGEILEDITVDKARSGLGRLLALTPATGRKLTATGEQKVHLQDVVGGDILRILPGETVPADGIIVKGNTSINQAAITGESLPVDKTIGDEVMAGTINCFGTVDIEVKTVHDTYLQKMINLVKEAQENKAPTQMIVDKWASILVPSALVTAFLAYLFTGDILRAVTVLVVFCPCALVLATPTAIMAAIGHAAKNGVLIKSGSALEEMGKVDTVVFDKTGTLTTGNIQIADIISFNEQISAEELLALTAGLEQYSEHALAKAIVRKAADLNIKLPQIDNFTLFPGKGVCGTTDKHILCAGNVKFLQERKIVFSDANIRQLHSLQDQGKALAIVALSDKVIGVIALSDAVRTDVPQMLNELQRNNTDVIVLTGDNSASARYFAQKSGIKHIYADLLPENKVAKIKELQTAGRHICMIGDGINDAPALKTANVGIAMGTIGTDIAIDAADITFINDNICSLPYLRWLSQLTIRTIKSNIFISMMLNFIGIVLSFYGILGPMSGAILHNLGSIVVVVRSGRLYGRSYVHAWCRKSGR